MKAKEALEISEAGDNALKNLLYSIQAMANSGCRYASWDRSERVIREKEITALKELGYTIKINGDNVRAEW